MGMGSESASTAAGTRNGKGPAGPESSGGDEPAPQNGRSMIHQTPEAVGRSVDRHLRRLQAFATAIGEMPADAMVGDTWDLRQAVAHLVSWTREFAREIVFTRDHPGESVPWTITTGVDYGAWNRARIAEWIDLPWENLLAQWLAEADRLARTVKGCTAKELRHVTGLPWESQKGNIPFLVAAWIQHERQHMAKIRKALGIPEVKGRRRRGPAGKNPGAAPRGWRFG